MASDRLSEILETLELAAQRKLYRAKDFFVPYPKQIAFCNLGKDKRERVLFAGNQTGKTEIGAYEAVCHLTGEYPDWWLGRRFDAPTKCWAAGVTGLSTRDIVQKKLLGEPGIVDKFGSGMIPKESIIGHPTLARGVSNAYDKCIIRHSSGGESVLMFKSYEQGREKWQGDTLDFLWFDEEPPEDIYSEGLARLREGGMSYLTFTPLLGKTQVVMSFTDNLRDDQGIVYMSLDDVDHFSPEEKKRRIAAMPAHERESRERGIPARGSGAVFQTPLGLIEEDLDINNIPTHWPWLWGVDFGVGHPFAAVLGVWDKDADIIHIVHCFRIKDAGPVIHARMMKPFGHVKVAWPQDGHKRDQGNLKPLAKQYKTEGLAMMDSHATFPDGSNSTEAGVTEMDERFKTGRLKVARHLTEWFQEYTNYHRKDGLLVKLHDDLMSATRVLVMARRHAAQRRQRPGKGQRGAEIARDIDFDLA